MDEDHPNQRLRSVLESLLFSTAEPVTLARLVQLLPAWEKKEIEQALQAMADEYQTEERGFRLHQVSAGWQIRTARANADYVKALHQQKPQRLTRASLETLAVVAYRQPVTKAEIEAIRGVDVSGVLTTLLDRRLIRVAGRKEVVGRPLLFSTTSEFLEVFGLKDLAALPTLDELGTSGDVLDRVARAAGIEAEEESSVEVAFVEEEGEPESAPVEIADDDPPLGSPENE
jgi:segregation and condensation protein B